MAIKVKITHFKVLWLSWCSLQERLSEQLEEQRQEQALQRYHSEAEELDHWLLSTKATLSSALQPHPEDMDMEEQLIDCQVRGMAVMMS